MNADFMASNWMESCSDVIETRWKCLPMFARNLIVLAAVFAMGSSTRGEWLLLWTYFTKAFYKAPACDLVTNATISNNSVDLWNLDLGDLNLQELAFYWFWATGVSFTIYILSGGFLHWHYYVRQRHSASEWKCQPNNFPSSDVVCQEILTGSLALILASSITGIVAYYVMNGGKCSIYYSVEDFGYVWYFLSMPVVFIWHDYLNYWHHRMYHHPFLYRHFHKIHHKYKHPTAFSVMAIHPVELFSLQAILFSPMFLYPVHWTVFVGSSIYNFCHGIIDHSGVDFKAPWWQPWQPDVIFHDNHHQYTYGNFGINCKLWDKIHGTERKMKKEL